MRNARSTTRGVGTALLLMAALGWSGCRTTVQNVQMERVDQSPGGNGGYFIGHPQAKPARSGTREIAELQVELPNRTAQRGQPGMMTTTPAAAESPAMEQASTPSAAGAEGASELYTVKKGDTLWSIAHKMYGKGGLWQRIYEANRDKLSDPGRLRAGMRLHIPRESVSPSSAPSTYEK